MDERLQLNHVTFQDVQCISPMKVEGSHNTPKRLAGSRIPPIRLEATMSNDNQDRAIRTGQQA